LRHSGPRKYLQIVENRWEDGRPRQYVIATPDRLDRLKASGQIDAIMRSLSRFFREGKGGGGLQGRQDQDPVCKEDRG